MGSVVQQKHSLITVFETLFNLLFVLLANRSVTWSCTSAPILGRSHTPAANVKRLSGRNSSWICTFGATMTPTLYPHPLFAPSAARPSLAGYGTFKRGQMNFMVPLHTVNSAKQIECLLTEYYGQTCRELHWYGFY